MFTNRTDVHELVEAWPYTFQQTDDGDPLHEYLRVYAQQFSRVDAFIDTIYEQRFIDTATGQELAKIGAATNVSRRNGETDDELRYRIRLERVVGRSNGTANDIVTVLGAAFGSDRARITVEPADGEPVLRLFVPQPVLDAVPLSRTALEETLRGGIPAGTGLAIITDDVFAFADPDEQPPQFAAGFGEGAWQNSS